MKITAIIQARTGSTRLPGKVLKRVLGKPLLEHQIERIRRAKSIDSIVLATTTLPGDNALEPIAKKLGIEFFRGSESDVLDRYYQAAKKFHAVHIMRVTGDCPCLDPNLVDAIAKKYSTGRYDYVNAGNPSRFPEGVGDVEIFSFKALEQAWDQARLPSEREHVTSFIYRRPKRFRMGAHESNEDFSHIRLTLDEPRDLTVIRTVFQELYPENPHFALDDILQFMKERPEIVAINSSIIRNEGYLKSLKQDAAYLRSKNEK